MNWKIAYKKQSENNIKTETRVCHFVNVVGELTD